MQETHKASLYRVNFCKLCPVFCSVIGATIISIGFYTVMWGKAKEELGDDCNAAKPESSCAQKVPLLQGYNATKLQDEQV